MLFIPRILMITALSFSSEAEPQTPATLPTAPATGFLYKTVVHEGHTYAYSVFVPPEYNADTAWPVILALHGSGERGSDGLLQTEVGLGTALRRNYRLIPALVVMPQCPEKQSWTGANNLMALKCVEAVSREYRCDKDRVYLTGLSMGGQGAWHIAAHWPNSFAAVVPICGFAEYGDSTGVAEQLATKLTNVPIWCFHGDADTSVPVAKTREIVAAIRKAGGEIRYSEYAGVGHNAWDRAYGDPLLWKWLFAQRRGATTKPADAPGSRPAGEP